MTIDVVIACSPSPREVFEQIVQLADASTARDAVLASDLPSRYPALDWQALTPGVRGRAIDWSALLAPGDRLELCRPLAIDPKVARRERFEKQGARAAGLFAKRRKNDR